VAKANIEAINSIGVLFSAVLYGSIGFYLGTNIPSLPAGRLRPLLSHGGPSRKVFPIALASGAGTFLAAFAALVSAYMIVFDEAPPVIWNVGIGFWWMVGVLLQLAADNSQAPLAN
jgi:predicted lysophospholipase L1 biosynthesis ABC-type transport system permease subunit